MGFPLADTQVAELRRASQRLGARFNEPHMNLGWCIVTEHLYRAQLNNLIADFNAIGAEMHHALELRHCGWEVVGATRDKLAAFYQPYDKKRGCIDDALFLKFNERILNLFRLAAQKLATQRACTFRSYLDPAQNRAIEVGEVGGIRVYEMKAVPPRFHVTVGGRGTAGCIDMLSTITCSPIEFPLGSFYCDAGKTRRI